MSTPRAGESTPKPRSRIVIDVDKAKHSAHKTGRGAGGGRRARRVLSLAGIVVAVLLVALLAGGYAWWQSYKRSPTYTLALLVDAAQRDDTQTVEQLLDTNQVAQSFIPQVMAQLAGGEGGAMPTAEQRQVEAALPFVLPQARDEIIRRVKEFATRSGGRMPFVILAIGVPRMVDDIKTQGDAATVSFKASDRPIELSMQRNGERWKLVGIKSDALAADLAGYVRANMPARAPDNGARRPPRQRR